MGKQAECEKFDITINEGRILEVVHAALKAREEKTGLFVKEIVPPEKAFIDLVKTIESQNKHPNYALHALFFVVMTVYLHDSTQQLSGMVKRFNHLHHWWLFEPRQVARTPKDEVIEAADDLIRPSSNRESIQWWRHNAQVLVDNYQGDIRNFFSLYEFDAPLILDNLMGPHRKTNWNGFHRFGPKIGRLFLQWVNQYNLAELQNIDRIGIPVDWQVARLMIQTEGVTWNPKKPVYKDKILDKCLTPFFSEFCFRHTLNSQVVSETLWTIGAKCCNRFKHGKCPLKDYCISCISRDPLDRDGKFDPLDTGRWKTARQVKLDKKLGLQPQLPLF